MGGAGRCCWRMEEDAVVMDFVPTVMGERKGWVTEAALVLVSM